MKSAKRGKSTSAVEITHIAADGLWILVNDEELYLGFKKFPWFKEAKVREIYNVKRGHADHLHWPDLDVDLDLDRVKRPDRYPLVYKK